MGQLAAKVASSHDPHRLYQKLNTLDSHTHSVWADVSKTGDTTSTLIGLDVVGQQHHTGAYLSHKTSDHTTSTIDADAKATGAGLYHQRDIGQIRLTADIGIDKLTLNTDRQVAWDGMTRNHSAKINGTRYFAGAKVGYGMAFDKLTLRPSVGIHAQKVQFDGITESGGQLSTALQYDMPSIQSVQGVVGLDMDYVLNDKVDLTASLAHYHEFKDSQDTTINAKLSSMPEYGKSYALPITLRQDDTQRADIGANIKLKKAILNAGLTASHTDGESDVGGYVGMQMKF